MKVAISGGLGFIGSRVARQLASQGADVVILDNLHPQIHKDDRMAGELSKIARVRIGSVEDAGAWDDVLDQAELVLHMAAETGTGQSMDDVVRYVDTNVRGTAQFAEALARHSSVKTVFLPSSRAVYGEGAYECPTHGLTTARARAQADMERGDFSVRCEHCNDRVEPAATPESFEARPASVYASTKLMQEQLLQQICERRTVDLRIARYQNVYGAGQALGNPYTGVLVIFAQQLLRGQRLDVYEDGQIVRDFIHVDDVVDATLTLIGESENPGIVNIGSGCPTSILDIIATLQRAFDRPVPYDVTGHFRFGDIRHALADISKAQRLGIRQRVTLDQGLHELAQWLAPSAA